MKTINEEILKLSWIELLSVIGSLTANSQIRYELSFSKSVEELFSEFQKTDIERALPQIYAIFFSDTHQEKFTQEIDELLRKLKQDGLDCRDSIFDDIEWMQRIVAMALWRYELSLKPELENFAREFERVDDEWTRNFLISKYQKID